MAEPKILNWYTDTEFNVGNIDKKLGMEKDPDKAAGKVMGQVADKLKGSGILTTKYSSLKPMLEHPANFLMVSSQIRKMFRVPLDVHGARIIVIYNEPREDEVERAVKQILSHE